MSTVVPSWAPRFSPHYYWSHVPEAAVPQQLRVAFSRWGLPQRLRVDNGKPWGSWSDLPPALSLWLIGLGLEVVWNDPRRPQQNGVVERSQGTGKRWAEPDTCQSVAELQGRLDGDDTLQRERYPLAQGQSRWQLFPGLKHSGRPYREEDEAERWSLERVREQVAGYALSRRVDSQGKVSVYNRNLYVGVVHKGQPVWVQFDPDQGCWLLSDRAGRQLRTPPAPEINAESIRGLQLAGRK
jgi:transposase InsO family protein